MPHFLDFYLQKQKKCITLLSLYNCTVFLLVYYMQLLWVPKRKLFCVCCACFTNNISRFKVMVSFGVLKNIVGLLLL